LSATGGGSISIRFTANFHYWDFAFKDMGFAWIGWYDLSDEDYKAEVAARKAEREKKATTTQQQQQQQ